jgi:hypothetical protein
MTFDEYYKQEFEDKKRQSSLKEDHKKTWDAAQAQVHIPNRWADGGEAMAGALAGM